MSACYRKYRVRFYKEDRECTHGVSQSTLYEFRVHSIIIPKYAKESRGWYGVCAPTIEGKRRPQMTKPWSYTERKSVSYKMYKQKVKEELVKKRNLKRGPWKSYNDDNTYEERYGFTWESEVCKSTALKPFRSVLRMIDHMIDEGNRMFAQDGRRRGRRCGVGRQPSLNIEK